MKGVDNSLNLGVGHISHDEFLGNTIKIFKLYM